MLDYKWEGEADIPKNNMWAWKAVAPYGKSLCQGRSKTYTTIFHWLVAAYLYKLSITNVDNIMEGYADGWSENLLCSSPEENIVGEGILCSFYIDCPVFAVTSTVTEVWMSLDMENATVHGVINVLKRRRRESFCAPIIRCSETQYGYYPRKI